MKVKMTASELVAKNQALNGVLERENEYIKTSGGMKFTSKVSIAIAKTLKAITGELELIVKEQDKHTAIAEKKGVKVEELPEQKEMMSSEIEFEIRTITEEDLEKCHVSSMDVCALMFMTENKEKEEKNNVED